MGVRSALTLLPLAAIVALFCLYAYAMQPHMNGYVSDEIWYVSAARNFINEVGGLGRDLAGFGVTVSPYPPAAPPRQCIPGRVLRGGLRHGLVQ